MTPDSSDAIAKLPKLKLQDTDDAIEGISDLRLEKVNNVMHFDTKFPGLVYTRLLFFAPVKSSIDVCLYSLLSDIYSEVGTTNYSPRDFGQLESAFTGGIEYAVDS